MSLLKTAPMRILATLAALMIGALIVVSEAQAGTYTARLCDQGFSADGDNDPFERSGNETTFTLTNACGAFNGLRVSHVSGQAGPQGTVGQWLADAPNGVVVKRIAYSASGQRSGGYFPHVVGTVDGVPGLDIINGDADLTGDFAAYSVDGSVRRFGVRLICQTDGSDCAATPDQPEARLKNIDYTLEDAAAPAISLTGGSLFEGPVQGGSQTIAFEASDAGSGVRTVLVLVNGELVAQQGADCQIAQGFARSMKPCPASVAGAIGVDTSALDNGINSVQVCVEDVSSSEANRACAPKRKVRILNGCAANPAAPASFGQTLELEWPGKRNAVAQTRQGRSRRATARVFGPAGEPLAGAAVCFSRSVPGRPGERVIESGVVTAPDGSASAKIRGASNRNVWATYWVNADTALTKKIRLDVSPRIRLELRPGNRLALGKKMRVVALLGGPWREDRRVCFYSKRAGSDRIGCDNTGAGGRARLGYQPPKAGKIRFYAKVPNQKDYPYVNGTSRVKRLKVVG